ncbi:hypothetical protein KY328_03615 [Candidatus Woesearchaeota archaeon]|nr:hypothetical protein [Candidatus Woesearchaeota archaeon]MBW3021983.1 hypothetical protein [Candidatus Woesearchaeota archaeon]
MKTRFRCDLHTHGPESDGVLTPEQTHSLSNQNRIDVLARTNHDTLEGTDALVELAFKDTDNRTFYMRGCAEIDCNDFEVLWYGAAYKDKDFFDGLRKSRVDAMLCMIYNLEKKHGVKLTQQEIEWILSHESPGRPHLREILVKKGFCKFENAFNHLLSSNAPESSRVHVPRTKPGIDVAIYKAHEAGARAVLAHPGKYKGSFEALHEKITEFYEMGGDGIECFYPYKTERFCRIRLGKKYHPSIEREVRTEIVAFKRELAGIVRGITMASERMFVMTGGSDAHDIRDSEDGENIQRIGSPHGMVYLKSEEVRFLCGSYAHHFDSYLRSLEEQEFI